MDVLTSETCWAVSNEIIKQVTSSWSLLIQYYVRLKACSPLWQTLLLPNSKWRKWKKGIFQYMGLTRQWQELGAQCYPVRRGLCGLGEVLHKTDATKLCWEWPWLHISSCGSIQSLQWHPWWCRWFMCTLAIAHTVMNGMLCLVL